MPTIYNTDPSELVEKASEELKNTESIKAPEWAPFVKTGMHKERPPIKSNLWYMRTASILKQVYKYGPIGVSKLRIKYGGKKNRGVQTEHFYKGSGNIIRKIMQQLEKEGFVKKDLKSVHKGRSITAKGKKFLDEIAGKISNIQVQQKKVEAKQKNTEKKEPVKEVKKPSKGTEKGLETRENRRFSVSQKSLISEKSKTFQKEKEQKAEPIKAEFAEDKVLTEVSDASRELYNQSRYGTLLDNGKVQLSLIEALYLMEKGTIEIHRSKKKLRQGIPKIQGRLQSFPSSTQTSLKRIP